MARFVLFGTPGGDDTIVNVDQIVSIDQVGDSTQGAPGGPSMSETRYVSADFTSGWIAGRDWQRDHGASAQLDAARAAIREALYDYDHGDELSAIDRLRAALAPRAPTEGACVLHEWTVDYRVCLRCGKVGEPDER